MNRSETATTPTLRVLLVEDSAADIALIEELVDELEIPVELQVARVGEQALRYLHRQGEWANTSPPDIVLLDLNLPTYDGLEVLHRIRNDPDEDIRIIPVIVLTTSTASSDVRTAYLLSANAYVTKPVDPDELRLILQSIVSFWARNARLPGRVTT